MLLRTFQKGEFVDIPIKEGEMFLLDAHVPHNPIRYADTIGLVIEITRPKEKLDSLRWYCTDCKAIVYEESFYCTNLGEQLVPVIRKWQGSEELRTCVCGKINK